VHDIGVIFADKYESGPPHVSRQLINLIESTVYDMSAEIGVTKITNNKIISFANGVFVIL
jgi:hypothetical protein